MYVFLLFPQSKMFIKTVILKKKSSLFFQKITHKICNISILDLSFCYLLTCLHIYASTIFQSAHCMCRIKKKKKTKEAGRPASSCNCSKVKKLTICVIHIYIWLKIEVQAKKKKRLRQSRGDLDTGVSTKMFRYSIFVQSLRKIQIFFMKFSIYYEKIRKKKLCIEIFLSRWVWKLFEDHM